MLNFIDDIGQKRICTVSNSWLGNQRHFVKRYRICKMISKIYQRLSAHMYVKLIYLWLQYTMIIATKAIRKQPNPSYRAHFCHALFRLARFCHFLKTALTFWKKRSMNLLICIFWQMSIIIDPFLSKFQRGFLEKFTVHNAASLQYLKNEKQQ